MSDTTGPGPFDDLTAAATRGDSVAVRSCLTELATSDPEGFTAGLVGHLGSLPDATARFIAGHLRITFAGNNRYNVTIREIQQ